MAVAAWRHPPVDAGFTQDGKTPLRRLQFRADGKDLELTMTLYDWMMVNAHMVSAAEIVNDRSPRGRLGLLTSYFVPCAP